MSESVIVTGIGSGIGFATAKMLLDNGYRVLGLDRSRGRFDELPEGERIFVEADVRDYDTQLAAFNEEAKQHAIAGLVCCAGIIQRKPYLELDEEMFDRHLDINLKGPFLGCKAVLPILRKQGKGSIVLFASSIARTGSATGAHYAATKGGILGLCRTLALETARDGIRVNVVCPGGVDTAMSTNALSNIKGEIDYGHFPKMMGVLPGMMAPVKIAEALAHLASDAASTTTGSLLVVDNGTLW